MMSPCRSAPMNSRICSRLALWPDFFGGFGDSNLAWWLNGSLCDRLPSEHESSAKKGGGLFRASPGAGVPSTLLLVWRIGAQSLSVSGRLTTGARAT